MQQIPCYGKDLSFAEILENPWFSQRLDYIGFVNECEELLGANSIDVFEYQHDTVKTVSQLLGLATPHDNPTPRKNTSMNAITTELYRVVNRLQLSAKEKEKLVPHLHDINAAINPYVDREDNSLVDEASIDKIKQMTTNSMLTLQKRFVK